MPRKICVILVDRANYGRMKPVMRAITDHHDLTLQTVAAGTMVLERFDMPVNTVKADGFDIDATIHMELEGSTPATMAKSIGLGIIEFASEFQRLNPDVVLLIGDRYEALSAAIAAGYMNICIAHVQGGEVSGSIDECARHAISKFAHYHFPSTKRSAEFLIKMGEDPNTILSIGCPSSDIARKFDNTLTSDIINAQGGGAIIDNNFPFVLTIFHPITTEYGKEPEQMKELMEALRTLQLQTILLWPNIDAGSDHISKAIRTFRIAHKPDWLRTITNLEPENYLKVLANACCAIGNSSSFVRDASYFGTPVVLIGNRQEGRETDKHVIQCPPLASHIYKTVLHQIKAGRYPSSNLYGDGSVSERMANSLATIDLYVQKRLNSNYLRNDTGQRRLEGSIAQKHS